MRGSRQMIHFWNIFAYFGDRPDGVSDGRWRAICRYFDNNFKANPSDGWFQ